MNRLQAELHRLYALPARDAAAPGPVDGQGQVRAAVLELVRPADWEALARVWRGVQAELELPAPAIAVSGSDGFQLWFSFLEPQSLATAQAFLEGLRLRYLGDVTPERVVLRPSPAAPLPHAPPLQLHDERWSAFVAPDLAPVFAGEPWLDTPPSADGQADLLQRLTGIQVEALRAAQARLGLAPPPAAAPAAPALAAAPQDPRSFLLRVMNDESVALALRIEAAKALLPWGEAPPRR